MTLRLATQGTATKTRDFLFLRTHSHPGFSLAKYETFLTLTFSSNFVPPCTHEYADLKANVSFQMTLTPILQIGKLRPRKGKDWPEVTEALVR